MRESLSTVLQATKLPWCAALSFSFPAAYWHCKMSQAGARKHVGVAPVLLGAECACDGLPVTAGLQPFVVHLLRCLSLEDSVRVRVIQGLQRRCVHALQLWAVKQPAQAYTRQDLAGVWIVFFLTALLRQIACTPGSGCVSSTRICSTPTSQDHFKSAYAAKVREKLCMFGRVEEMGVGAWLGARCRTCGCRRRSGSRSA